MHQPITRSARTTPQATKFLSRPAYQEDIYSAEHLREATDQALDAMQTAGKSFGQDITAAIAPNILDRRFQASAPNQKWAADFTYIWTAEGWLYVAVVIDLYSRRVVGWSMRASMNAELVTEALMMALWRRGKPDALMHHSDRGSQYTSEQFQRLMAEHGVA